MEPRPLLSPGVRLAPNWKLTLDFWMGGGSGRLIDQDTDEILAWGGTWMLAWKNLEFGVGLTSEVFLSWRFTTVGGVLVEPVPWLRLELLGEGGLESVGVMSSLFSSATDGTAWLPYLGARGGVSFPLARSHGLLLGAWVNAGSTVVRATVHPTVETCFLGCSTRDETHSVGGPSYAIGFRIGAYLR